MDTQTAEINFPGDFTKNFPLSDITTIRLGGEAEYFYICRDTDEIIRCIEISNNRKIPMQVISGGSNIIFPDAGCKGMVIKINNRGVRFEESSNGLVRAVCSAGEDWDEFVSMCVGKGLAGVECLSGIPGSVGSTPYKMLELTGRR